MMKTSNHTIPDQWPPRSTRTAPATSHQDRDKIPDQSPPRSTRTAPSTSHQDGEVKHAADASSKIRGRDITTFSTWTTRTQKAAGIRRQLTQKMDRCRWNIFGLCEMRRENFAKTATEEGHKVFFSGKDDKHEHGGFLVHKDIMNTVMGC